MPNPAAAPLYELAPCEVEDPISIEFMYKDLARSGLVPSDMAAYPIGNVFGVGQYVIPYHVPHMWVRRADTAVDKYRGPKGQTSIYLPPNQPKFSEDVLYIQEGEKKAVAFAKHFKLPCVGIRGCRGFTQGAKLLPELVSLIKPNMSIVIVFDGDIEANTQIQHAAHYFQSLLNPLHVKLIICKPPTGKGTDDWIVANPEAKLEEFQVIPLHSLEMGRKQLIQNAGIYVNEEGNFARNEDNAFKILATYYKDRVYVDKRMGLVIDGSVNVDENLFEGECVSFMQGLIDSRYRLGAITWGVAQMIRTAKKDLVRDLIKQTKWDGVPRLKTWGSEYFDTSVPAWANEWGRIFMTGWGLRLIEPGTKVDYAFIIVGPQGIGKTTFFEDLATFQGHRFYYALTSAPSASPDGNRTIFADFSRSAIVDLAEGALFDAHKGPSGVIKQLITETIDSYRIVYARHSVHSPRGFVFVGAMNDAAYLIDKSGSRRFLNLEVNTQKPGFIKRLPYEVKMQLLAEVNETREELGRWWEVNVDLLELSEDLRAMHPHITDAQELVNQSFTRQDSYTEFITRLIESDTIAKVTTGYKSETIGQKFISPAYVAACLRAEPGNIDMKARGLIAKILTELSRSPTFPYILTYHRVRTVQLTFPNDGITEYRYTDGITNNQGQLSGYLVLERKL